MAMLACATSAAPNACFVAGSAEALPFATKSMDLATAAGSLNYTDVPRALAEVRRVLAKGGVLVVYDFSQGRTFRDSSALDEWFVTFTSRYPPPGEGIAIDPRTFAGFTVKDYEEFEIGLELRPEFYVEYALTETNVAHAVRRGVPREQIRAWIEDSLRPVFQGCVREVLFRGYFACLLAL